MRRNSLLILAATVLLLAACGNKGGKSGLLVPKDAAIVVHINSASLSSKLSWEEIRQTNWFKEINKEADDTLARQLLADPGNSGIDTKADLVFFMKKQGKGGYLVFEGSLKDAAAFEKMLKELKKESGPAETKKDGDFSYMTSDDGVVLWSSSKFAYIANAPMPDTKSFFEGYNSRDSKEHAFLNDSLRLFGQQALTLKSGDNLDTDSRFADLVKDGSDLHLWMNAEGYYGNMMGGMMSMMKLGVLFKDNVSAASMNFDNGKITARSKTYYGEEMSKLLAEYKPQPVSAELINRIPSSNVAAVMAFNYPPKGLQAFLKTIGVDGMANGFLAEMNYSIEDFVKANKGDILVAVSDLSMVAKQDTIDYGGGMKPYVYTSTKPDMKVLFATSVNDKAAFEKLVTLAWEATKGMKDKDIPEISYKLENNWFVAGNSAEQIANFINGGNSNLPFVNKISGKPFGFYLDLNKIINMAAATFNNSDSSGKEALDLSLKMWKDVVATGGDYKDKALISDFEINLGDPNTNSLKQLNQYFDKLASLKNERRKKFAEEYGPATDAPAEVAPAN
ncbi:MAG: DUF4836 family protein [Chitinophagaceae bacterium]|nr:DUF4836 family protein [Chitinophagaceae bacterium]